MLMMSLERLFPESRLSVALKVALGVPLANDVGVGQLPGLQRWQVVEHCPHLGAIGYCLVQLQIYEAVHTFLAHIQHLKDI